MFNKVLEVLNIKTKEINNNTMTAVKNALEGVNSRKTEAEE